MHKIDLLKGQGVPAKTTKGGIIVLAVTVTVPILVAAGTLGWYSQTKIDIAITTQSIVNSKEMISQYSADLKLKQSLDQKIDLLNSQLSEISRCLDTFIQWSPILVTLSDNMPSGMIMTELAAQSQSLRRTTRRRKNDPKKASIIPIPERTMVMNIRGGSPGSYDTVVQGYQERLNSSPVLKPRLKEIIHSKEAGTMGTDQTGSHVMNIIFASESQ